MRSIVIIVIALLIGILLTLVTLDATGTANVFGSNNQGEQTMDPDDYVFIPLSRRDIPAFSSVSYEDVFTPEGAPNFRPVLKGDVPSDPAPLLIDDFVTRINGRVLKNTKPANRYFIESDFMPAGTSPGVAGAIPGGKRGITILAENVVGSASLQEGDRFDLLVTNRSGGSSSAGSSLLGGGSTMMGGNIDSVVLVNNGYVIRPVTTRLETRDKVSGLLGQKTSTETYPVKEMSIAVDPEEAIGLTSALASGRQLLVAVRSGQIGAEDQDRDIRVPGKISMATTTSPAKAEANIMVPKAIEVIVGDDRSNYIYQP